jgi:uncharacterized RDD family membrane protein YckC
LESKARPPRPVLYASFWRRLGGFVIDDVVVLLAALVVQAVVGFLIALAAGPAADPFKSQDARDVLGTLLWLVISPAYCASMECSRAQGTLGKMAFGIIVTDRAGRRITFWRSLVRFAGKLLSNGTFGLGYLLATLTPKKQALHDLVAGTLVVRAD